MITVKEVTSYLQNRTGDVIALGGSKYQLARQSYIELFAAAVTELMVTSQYKVPKAYIGPLYDFIEC